MHYIIEVKHLSRQHLILTQHQCTKHFYNTIHTLITAAHYTEYNKTKYNWQSINHHTEKVFSLATHQYYNEEHDNCILFFKSRDVETNLGPLEAKFQKVEYLNTNNKEFCISKTFRLNYQAIRPKLQEGERVITMNDHRIKVFFLPFLYTDCDCDFRDNKINSCNERTLKKCSISDPSTMTYVLLNKHLNGALCGGCMKDS